MELYSKGFRDFWVWPAFNTTTSKAALLIMVTQRLSLNYNEALDRDVRFPVYSVISVEILANSIRDDQSIMGVTIKGKEYKLSQYADDTSCFVRDIDSVVKLFEKLEAFKSCSGLELNRSKTEAMWLGKNNPQPTNLLGINWPSICVCLDVCFSCDSKISVKDNFEKKIACSGKMSQHLVIKRSHT